MAARGLTWRKLPSWAKALINTRFTWAETRPALGSIGCTRILLRAMTCSASFVRCCSATVGSEILASASAIFARASFGKSNRPQPETGSEQQGARDFFYMFHDVFSG